MFLHVTRFAHRFIDPWARSASAHVSLFLLFGPDKGSASLAFKHSLIIHFLPLSGGRSFGGGRGGGYGGGAPYERRGGRGGGGFRGGRGGYSGGRDRDSGSGYSRRDEY
jgi:hypothetical protein